MKTKMALVFYYHKDNKYSFNALGGALETDEYFHDLDVYFISSAEELGNELPKIIQNNDKTVLGLSFFTTQLWEIQNLITRLQAVCSRLPVIIAGGPHPTGDPRGTLEMGIDVVVRGEGEETFLELLKAVDQNLDYRSVKGIAYFDARGEYRYTGPRESIDLDKYPPFSLKYNKFGHVEITRGCPFACSFCQTAYIFGGRVRHRGLDMILKYAEILMKNNRRDFRVITPNAFSYGSPDGKKLNLPKLEQLLKRLKEIIHPRGKIFFGSFPSEVRPEHVNKETIGLVKQYADNDNLVIGAQSGSGRILELCRRGHTVEDVYHAVKLTIQSGLKANVDFIFGLPGETEEDIKHTIRVIEELSEIGAKIHAHTFIPLPQTPFADKPSGHLNENILRMLQRLIPKGSVYGQWREQEHLGKKITEYLKTNYKFGI